MVAPGVFLLKSYLNPFTEAIRDWLAEATAGKAGPRNKASTLIEQIDPAVAAYIALRVILTYAARAGGNTPTLLTTTAAAIGRAIGHEIRIKQFEADHAEWFRNLTRDFERRELTPAKRLEYFRKILAQADEPWAAATTGEYIHAGLKLIDIFTDLSGDVDIRHIRQGRKTIVTLVPTPSLLEAVQVLIEKTSGLATSHAPMVVPPVPWSPDTLRRGGYISHHTPPYRLVKRGKGDYMKLLADKARDGELDDVLDAINSIQETPWRIGTTADLVMSVMLFTGASRADAVRLGPANLSRSENGELRLSYRRQKMMTRDGAVVDIPVHPELARRLNMLPDGQNTFLQTAQGRARSSNGIGNSMREWCDAAGLPQCASHGLRKACARRLAEAGATPHEIMAVTGHKTLAQVSHYTEEVARRGLADSAFRRLGGGGD